MLLPWLTSMCYVLTITLYQKSIVIEFFIIQYLVMVNRKASSDRRVLVALIYVI